MAQDKSAEIIKFSGAGAPPKAPAAEPLAAESGPEDSPSALDDVGAGAYLRAARHKADLTIEQASAATKVKTDHLEAIEWMRLDRLPALPYASGFVKAYARYLGLDADAVAASFRREALAATPVPVAAAPERDAPQGEGARLGSVFAMLAVILFALWVGYQVLIGGARQHQTQQDIQPPRADTAIAEGRGAPAPPDLQAAPQPAAADAPVPETLGEEASGEQAATPEVSVAPPMPPAEENDVLSTDENAAAAETPPAATPPVVEAPERPLPRRAPPQSRQPVIVEAELIRPIAPDYPDRCTRRADDVESVMVRFDVSAEGRVVNARVGSSSNDCFDSEALRTVGRWRFNPRTIDGAAAVEGGKTATLNFRK